ncbi:MAG: hypothetical protein Q9217_002808 [Psora testacea]
MGEPRIGDRSALVVFGSETGTAIDYAQELGRKLERIRFSTHSSLNSFTIVVVVISTTGQGDLPHNARSFWKALLRKRLPPTYLRDTQYTSFGLGDSSYPRFNWAARKVHKRLTQLGASEFYNRGEGDAQHEEGLDASFVPWALGLRNDLLRRHSLPRSLNPIPEDILLPPKWLLSLADAQEVGYSKGQLNGAQAEIPIDQENIFVGADNRMIVMTQENKRMTPKSHWQDVRHLVFAGQSSASYEPGDVLTIYPQNAAEDVNRFIKRMEWDQVADEAVAFTPTCSESSTAAYKSSPPIKLPSRSPITLRQLLINHLDLTAIPRRSFFSLIVHFTTNQYHKDRLLDFAKPEYIDELYDYTTRPRRSILEVLQEFNSVKIPWQWAATILPELRGRQFSLASGGQLKQTPTGCARFELLVAIVKYKTVIKKVREGVCSRYLAKLQPGTRIGVTLQKGGLGIKKEEAQKPVVMIGPGTGLAPMRSLIWERLRWREDRKTAIATQVKSHVDGLDEIGKTLLVYGCRNKAADYFYSDEWELLGRHMSLEVHTAFSRDQQAKIYVQDVIRQQGTEIRRLIQDLAGVVYVCGSSGNMPKAVRAALADVFRQSSTTEPTEAEAYLEQLEREGRYKQETW